MYALESQIFLGRYFYFDVRIKEIDIIKKIELIVFVRSHYIIKINFIRRKLLILNSK